MELKFYLNKFLKVDNIEGYTIGALEELRKSYDRFLEKSGFDPDFPMMSIGDKKNKGKTIATGKNNLHQVNKKGGGEDENIDPLDEGDFTLTK